MSSLPSQVFSSNGKQNDRQSESNALTIKERIEIMTECVDEVEKTQKLDQWESDHETIGSTSIGVSRGSMNSIPGQHRSSSFPPRCESPQSQKFASVIDMWRNRDSHASSVDGTDGRLPRRSPSNNSHRQASRFAGVAAHHSSSSSVVSHLDEESSVTELIEQDISVATITTDTETSALHGIPVNTNGGKNKLSNRAAFPVPSKHSNADLTVVKAQADESDLRKTSAAPKTERPKNARDFWVQRESEPFSSEMQQTVSAPTLSAPAAAAESPHDPSAQTLVANSWKRRQSSESDSQNQDMRDSLNDASQLGPAAKGKPVHCARKESISVDLLSEEAEDIERKEKPKNKFLALWRERDRQTNTPTRRQQERESPPPPLSRGQMDKDANREGVESEYNGRVSHLGVNPPDWSKRHQSAGPIIENNSTFQRKMGMDQAMEDDRSIDRIEMSSIRKSPALGISSSQISRDTIVGQQQIRPIPASSSKQNQSANSSNSQYPQNNHIPSALFWQRQQENRDLNLEHPQNNPIPNDSSWPQHSRKFPTPPRTGSEDPTPPAITAQEPEDLSRQNTRGENHPSNPSPRSRSIAQRKAQLERSKHEKDKPQRTMSCPKSRLGPPSSTQDKGSKSRSERSARLTQQNVVCTAASSHTAKIGATRAAETSRGRASDRSLAVPNKFVGKKRCQSSDSAKIRPSVGDVRKSLLAASEASQGTGTSLGRVTDREQHDYETNDLAPLSLTARDKEVPTAQETYFSKGTTETFPETVAEGRQSSQSVSVTQLSSIVNRAEQVVKATDAPEGTMIAMRKVASLRSIRSNGGAGWQNGQSFSSAPPNKEESTVKLTDTAVGTAKSPRRSSVDVTIAANSSAISASVGNQEKRKEKKSLLFGNVELLATSQHDGNLLLSHSSGSVPNKRRGSEKKDFSASLSQIVPRTTESSPINNRPRSATAAALVHSSLASVPEITLRRSRSYEKVTASDPSIFIKPKPGKRSASASRSNSLNSAHFSPVLKAGLTLALDQRKKTNLYLLTSNKRSPRSPATTINLYPTLPSPSSKTKMSRLLDCHVLFLFSSQTMARGQASIQEQSVTILKAHHIPYQEIDGSIKSNHDRRNELFNISGIWAKYPQIFVQDGNQTLFWGEMEDLQRCNENGTLLESLVFFPCRSSRDSSWQQTQGTLNSPLLTIKPHVEILPTTDQEKSTPKKKPSYGVPEVTPKQKKALVSSVIYSSPSRKNEVKSILSGFEKTSPRRVQKTPPRRVQTTPPRRFQTTPPRRNDMQLHLSAVLSTPPRKHEVKLRPSGFEKTPPRRVELTPPRRVEKKLPRRAQTTPPRRVQTTPPRRNEAKALPTGVEKTTPKREEDVESTSEIISVRSESPILRNLHSGSFVAPKSVAMPSPKATPKVRFQTQPQSDMKKRQSPEPSYSTPTAFETHSKKMEWSEGASSLKLMNLARRHVGKRLEAEMDKGKIARVSGRMTAESYQFTYNSLATRERQASSTFPVSASRTKYSDKEKMSGQDKSDPRTKSKSFNSDNLDGVATGTKEGVTDKNGQSIASPSKKSGDKEKSSKTDKAAPIVKLASLSNIESRSNGSGGNIPATTPATTKEGVMDKNGQSIASPSKKSGDKEKSSKPDSIIKLPPLSNIESRSNGSGGNIPATTPTTTTEGVTDKNGKKYGDKEKSSKPDKADPIVKFASLSNIESRSNGSGRNSPASPRRTSRDKEGRSAQLQTGSSACSMKDMARNDDDLNDEDVRVMPPIWESKHDGDGKLAPLFIRAGSDKAMRSEPVKTQSMAKNVTEDHTDKRTVVLQTTGSERQTPNNGTIHGAAVNRVVTSNAMIAGQRWLAKKRELNSLRLQLQMKATKNSDSFDNFDQSGGENNERESPVKVAPVGRSDGSATLTKDNSNDNEAITKTAYFHRDAPSVEETSVSRFISSFEEGQLHSYQEEFETDPTIGSDFMDDSVMNSNSNITEEIDERKSSPRFAQGQKLRMVESASPDKRIGHKERNVSQSSQPNLEEKPSLEYQRSAKDMFSTFKAARSEMSVIKTLALASNSTDSVESSTLSLISTGDNTPLPMSPAALPILSSTSPAETPVSVGSTNIHPSRGDRNFSSSTSIESQALWTDYSNNDSDNLSRMSKNSNTPSHKKSTLLSDESCTGLAPMVTSGRRLSASAPLSIQTLPPSTTGTLSSSRIYSVLSPMYNRGLSSNNETPLSSESCTALSPASDTSKLRSLDRTPLSDENLEVLSPMSCASTMLASGMSRTPRSNRSCNVLSPTSESASSVKNSSVVSRGDDASTHISSQILTLTETGTLLSLEDASPTHLTLRSLMNTGTQPESEYATSRDDVSSQADTSTLLSSTNEESRNPMRDEYATFSCTESSTPLTPFDETMSESCSALENQNELKKGRFTFTNTDLTKQGSRSTSSVGSRASSFASRTRGQVKRWSRRKSNSRVLISPGQGSVGIAATETYKSETSDVQDGFNASKPVHPGDVHPSEELDEQSGLMSQHSPQSATSVSTSSYSSSDSEVESGTQDSGTEYTMDESGTDFLESILEDDQSRASRPATSRSPVMKSVTRRQSFSFEDVDSHSLATSATPSAMSHKAGPAQDSPESAIARTGYKTLEPGEEQLDGSESGSVLSPQVNAAAKEEDDETYNSIASAANQAKFHLSQVMADVTSVLTFKSFQSKKTGIEEQDSLFIGGVCNKFLNFGREEVALEAEDIEESVDEEDDDDHVGFCAIHHESPTALNVGFSCGKPCTNPTNPTESVTEFLTGKTTNPTASVTEFLTGKRRKESV